MSTEWTDLEINAACRANPGVSRSMVIHQMDQRAKARAKAVAKKKAKAAAKAKPEVEPKGDVKK